MLIGTSLGTEFQFKLTIFIFWIKFTQKGYFQAKKEKVNITTELAITVLKISFQKREVKVFNYRDNRNFSNEEFRQHVLKDIIKPTQSDHIVTYETF